jgi:hypothetical protein
MPKIGNSIPNEEMPCPRCGSKRKVLKKWKEKIQNSSGFMTLEHTQIICTNKTCQQEFDDVIAADALKREKLKQIKLDDAAKKASRNSA